MSSKGFSLAEILVAVVLMGVIILAVTSVDITSRRFLGTSSKESWVQDEGKIAMEHIARNLQLGIGDMTNPRAMGDDPDDASGCSRGFYILDVNGYLVGSGDRIQINQDTDGNGRFDGADKTVEYTYVGFIDDGLDNDYRIVYDEDLAAANPTEDLAAGIVELALFSTSGFDNQVEVTITVRRIPGEAQTLENPVTTLISDIILRAMSTN